jgi:hypothetical protein
MSRYTEGVCGDGVAILRDGEPMSPNEIVSQLNLIDGMVETQIRLQRSIDALRDQYRRAIDLIEAEQ